MRILDTEIEKGKSYQLSINLAKSHLRNSMHVPVIIHRAKKDGPVVLLNGAVHGDELNGIDIIRRLISKGYHKPKRGTIICIPVLNVFGYLNVSRNFPDGRDLNRVFPGTKNGSLASQLAYRFAHEIAPHVDLMLDFHTGGADRVNAPQIRCADTDKKALELAEVFGAPFIVHSKAIPKSLREMMNKKEKSVLLFEGGKSSVFEENVIQHGVAGTIRVLNHLGMTKELKESESKPVTIAKSRWIRACYSGMFHPLIENGSQVNKKDTLGFITDPYGDFKRKVKAPFDGHVFCVNTAPIVYKGDALFNVGVTTANEDLMPEL
ncbi:MAG: succinylglutamate desuccinylase/aspartoacylase family protein [Crocinitomicaceae bacterium]|nr:succinylglutamate desuccinylase/aspartoacylase family protein [Crocinitomicaceae bacterium]